MSKTIEEIRNEVAIDFGYKNLDQLLIFNDSCIVDIINKVAERYSQSQTQELKEQNAELVDMYKECFEMFIPSDKWDEATEFLSTYGSGLAKDLYRKEKHNHLNKNP